MQDQLAVHYLLIPEAVLAIANRISYVRLSSSEKSSFSISLLYPEVTIKPPGEVAADSGPIPLLATGMGAISITQFWLAC